MTRQLGAASRSFFMVLYFHRHLLTGTGEGGGVGGTGGGGGGGGQKTEIIVYTVATRMTPALRRATMRVISMFH